MLLFFPLTHLQEKMAEAHDSKFWWNNFMVWNWTECRNFQTSIWSFKKRKWKQFSKGLKKDHCWSAESTPVIWSDHWGRGVQAVSIRHRSLISWTGALPRATKESAALGTASSHIHERILEAAEFPSLTPFRHQGCPGALRLSIQGGQTGEVSHRMTHSTACWKCLHLIRQVLKDTALFQQQKNINCEIPTPAKISPDISEWSFIDIFTEACSCLAGKNLTSLFRHVTPHFHCLSLSSLPSS